MTGIWDAAELKSHNLPYMHGYTSRIVIATLETHMKSLRCLQHSPMITITLTSYSSPLELDLPPKCA